jgi:hypothetical protein
MKRRFMLLFLSISLLFGSKLASQVRNNPRVEALKRFLADDDFPEVFGNTQYRMRVEETISVDIDNDGKNELVVLTHPNYRQSASVIIYKVSPELEITRVTEGLALGPLQKVSANYIDSHGIGEAVDSPIDPD